MIDPTKCTGVRCSKNYQPQQFDFSFSSPSNLFRILFFLLALLEQAVEDLLELENINSGKTNSGLS